MTNPPPDAADVAARLRARVEQAEAEAGVGYIDWNLTTDAVRVSSGVLRICGEDLEGEWQTPAFLERLVHPDDLDRVRASLGAAAAGEAKHDLVHRVLTVDGATRWVHATAVLDPVGADGDPHLMGLLQDITERVEAQQALERAVARLEEATVREREVTEAQRLEALGLLAAGVAHDFNNVLSVILTSAQILEEELEDEDLREDASEIVRASQRAARLSRQLLSFSRPEASSPTVILLDEFLRELSPTLRRLLPESVLLSEDVAAELHVYMDRGQLEQVLMNLVVNARDAMPGGGRLRLGAHRVAGGAFACLEVSDTGAGMDDDTLARIFEPFFSTKAPGRGTGLGLATTKRVVEHAGGSVRVRSRVGHGTTFCVHLPLATPAQVAETEPGEMEMRAPAQLAILVVEDDSAVRRAVARVLEGAGHRVQLVGDGLEAAGVFQREAGAFDLVISDLVMPGMSGVETVALLRRESPELPALFISGYSAERVAVRDAGEVCLPKPFTAAELLRVVERAASS